MRIHGIEHLTLAEVDEVLAAGGRLVFFEYCISLVIATQRRPSSIYLLRPGEMGLVRGLPFSLISLLFGWWGIPWGLIYTPLTLITNFSGGRDVTIEVRALLEQSHNSSASPTGEIAGG